MKQYRVYFRGRVQGVGFRARIRKLCIELGVNGYCQNLNSGAVLGIFQCSSEKLKEIIGKLNKKGLQSIYHLEVYEEKLVERFDRFEVRRGNIFIDKFKAGLNLISHFIGDLPVKVPKHIAIIPDGNRRWAKMFGKRVWEGHRKAASSEHMESLMDEARNNGVKYMTFWAFSTENWKRDEKEKKELFRIINDSIKFILEKADKNKIRIIHIGRKDRLPKFLVDTILNAEKKTKDNDSFYVSIAIDYGGRDELLRAMNKLRGKANETNLKNNLDTKELIEPDLIIRTGGEKRLSGFMPFQSVYSELYFSDKYFPDFNFRDLRRAILDYSKRQRRFGR